MKRPYMDVFYVILFIVVFVNNRFLKNTFVDLLAIALFGIFLVMLIRRRDFGLANKLRLFALAMLMAEIVYRISRLLSA